MRPLYGDRPPNAEPESVYSAYHRGYEDGKAELGKAIRNAYDQGYDDGRPEPGMWIVLALIGASTGAILPFIIAAWIAW